MLQASNAALKKVTRPGSMRAVSKAEARAGLNGSSSEEIVWEGHTPALQMSASKTLQTASDGRVDWIKTPRIQVPALGIQPKDILEVVVNGQEQTLRVIAVEDKIPAVGGAASQILEFQTT